MAEERRRDRKGILQCIAANASSWIYTTLDGVNRPRYGVEEKMPLRIQRPDGSETYTIEWNHVKVYKKEQLEQTQRAMLEFTLKGPPSDPAEERVLLVVYAGTESELDVLADIGVTMNAREFEDLGLGVHSCMHAMTVSGAASADIETRALQHFDHIVLCGHSLGGALAQLAALSKFFVDEVHTRRGLSPADAARVKFLRRRISAAQVLLAELDGQDDSLRAELEKDSRSLEALRCTEEARVHCFSFGAPMPFAPLHNLSPAQTEKFTEVRRWLAEHCETFVNNNDLVPRLPGEIRFVLERVKVLGKLDVCVPVVKKALYSIDCAALAEHLQRQFALLEMYKHMTTMRFVGHTRPDEAEPCVPEQSGLRIKHELCQRHDKDQRHRRGWLEIERSLADWYTGDLSADRLDHLMDIYIELVYMLQGVTGLNGTAVWGLDLRSRTNEELGSTLDERGVPKPRSRRKSDYIAAVQKEYITRMSRDRSRSQRRAQA